MRSRTDGFELTAAGRQLCSYHTVCSLHAQLVTLPASTQPLSHRSAGASSAPLASNLDPGTWTSWYDARVSVFSRLLAQFQQRWPSRRSVAARAGVDHARYNRLVRGEVKPARREQVLAVAQALGLTPREIDQLAAAAGYLPPSLEQSGLDDPAVQAVLDLYARTDLSEQDRAAFRAVVAEIAARWTPSGDRQ